MSAGDQLSAPGAAAVIAAPTPRRSESSGALPRIEAAIERLPQRLLRGQIAQQVVDVRQFEEDRGLSGAFELGLAVELARLREVPAGEGGVSGALQPGPGGRLHVLEAPGPLGGVVPGPGRPALPPGGGEALPPGRPHSPPALPPPPIAGAP